MRERAVLLGALLIFAATGLVCASGENVERPKLVCSSDQDCPKFDGCETWRCEANMCVSRPQNPNWDVCDCEDLGCKDKFANDCYFRTDVLFPGQDDIPGFGGVFGCYANHPFKRISGPTSESSELTVFVPGTVFMDAADEGGPEATVWYYGADHHKYLFSYLGAFESWFGKGAERCCVVRTVTHSVFNKIPRGLMAGGKVCYRPGHVIRVSREGKLWNSIYIVSHKCTVRQISEKALYDLYGSDWENRVELIPFAHYFNYFAGPKINSLDDYDLFEELESSRTIDENQELR